MSLIGLEWQKSLASWDGTNFSPLEVPRAILEELGNPQDSYLSIHIAGTNGKGSVATYIESILIHSKKWECVAKTISPQILSITEVARINGKDSSLDDIDKCLMVVKDICEKIEVQPTQYVALLVATFYLFRENRVDIAIVEAGLGGRFDATNVLNNKILNIITSIGLEHEAQLGETIQEIAWHKAGIIGSNIITIVGEVSSEVLEVVNKNASYVNSEVIAEGRDYLRSGELVSFKGLEVNLKIDNIEPEYKLKNRALSVIATCVLGVVKESIDTGLRDSHCPGRFELYSTSEQGSVAIIDVAHNPDGISELFSPRCLDYYKSFDSINIIVTLLRRKNWQKILTLLIQNLDPRFKLILFHLSEDFVCGEELSHEFPQIEYGQIKSLQEFVMKNPRELNLFLGSTALYAPFTCWAQSQKLLRVNGH